LEDTIWRDGKHCIGVPYAFDPLDLTDDALATLFFRGRKKSFILHLGEPSDAAEQKVRMNGKIRPRDIGISFPSAVSAYVKTAVGLRHGCSVWETIEDRADMHHETQLHGDFLLLAVFAQPRRQLRNGQSYICGVRPEAMQTESRAMGAFQRKTWNEGVLATVSFSGLPEKLDDEEMLKASAGFQATQGHEESGTAATTTSLPSGFPDAMGLPSGHPEACSEAGAYSSVFVAFSEDDIAKNLSRRYTGSVEHVVRITSLRSLIDHMKCKKPIVSVRRFRHDLDVSETERYVLNTAASDGLHFFIMCPYVSEIANVLYQHLDFELFEYSAGKGNLICFSTYTRLCNYFHEWSWLLSGFVPKTAQDVDNDFIDCICQRVRCLTMLKNIQVAFPVEGHEAERESIK
jgi:hypothetical protein